MIDRRHDRVDANREASRNEPVRSPQRFFNRVNCGVAAAVLLVAMAVFQGNSSGNDIQSLDTGEYAWAALRASGLALMCGMAAEFLFERAPQAGAVLAGLSVTSWQALPLETATGKWTGAAIRVVLLLVAVWHLRPARPRSARR